MMKIAFYKGTKEGIAGVYNIGVRWIEDGLYSHCEVVFSNGLSASSSFMDGGVRFKEIEYDLDKWDIFELPYFDEEYAYNYFVQRIGKPYNLRGNIHFVFGFIRGNSDGVFCSEACAEALGLEKGWQFAPNALAHIIKLVDQRNKMLKLNKVVGEGEDTGSGDNPTNPNKPPIKPPAKP